MTQKWHSFKGVSQLDRITCASPYHDIVKDFIANDIPIVTPGFYDHKNFIKIEEKNPKYIENYASFVSQKSYECEYLERVEREALLIVNLLLAELEKDGRLGACVDVNMALSKILEKEGYWNYIANGALIIDFPSLANVTKKYFWPYDINPEIKAGHVWCVVPPFHVIDITLKQQPYSGNERMYLPNMVSQKEISICSVESEDIFSPEVREEMRLKGLLGSEMISVAIPELPVFFKVFKPTEIELKGLIFKYVPCAINAPDAELSDIKSLKLNGKYSAEIYNDIIKPALEKFRNEDK